MDDQMSTLVCCLYKWIIQSAYNSYFKHLLLYVSNTFSLFIGGIIVGISAKGARLQHWIDMIKHPGQTTTQTHFLSASFVDWMDRWRKNMSLADQNFSDIIKHFQNPRSMKRKNKNNSFMNWDSLMAHRNYDTIKNKFLVSTSTWVFNGLHPMCSLLKRWTVLISH